MKLYMCLMALSAIALEPLASARDKQPIMMNTSLRWVHYESVIVPEDVLRNEVRSIEQNGVRLCINTYTVDYNDSVKAQMGSNGPNARFTLSRVRVHKMRFSIIDKDDKTIFTMLLTTGREVVPLLPEELRQLPIFLRPYSPVVAENRSILRDGAVPFYRSIKLF